MCIDNKDANMSTKIEHHGRPNLLQAENLLLLWQAALTRQSVTTVMLLRRGQKQLPVHRPRKRR